MKLMYNDREVMVIKIEHGFEYCDSYITEAVFLDNGEDLEEIDLLQLTEENLDFLYEGWLDTQYAFGLVR